MYRLPYPSNEQRNIIKAVGKNIICNAVAGSGKTTTVLHIARAHPELNIYQVTYNAMLKLEVRTKVTELMLTNIQVHSYHSLFVRHYSSDCYNDTKLSKAILKNVPIRNKPKVDILIVDEVQDMTTLYITSLKKFMHDAGATDASIILLGDVYQTIYTYSGSDKRFLSLGDKLWNGESLTLPLCTSYRLTIPMAWFINECMLGSKRISSIKEGAPVQYIGASPFKWKMFVSNVLSGFFSKGYKPDDVFILSPSIRSDAQKTPLKLIENDLVRKRYPVFTANSDDQKLDSDVIEKKIVICSYHQSKGRERKIVVMLDFNDDYFDYCGRDYDRRVCPPTMYVAATRALEHLILVGDNDNPPTFFNVKAMLESDKVLIIGKRPKPRILPNVSVPSVELKRGVVDLVRHLPETYSISLDYLVTRIETSINDTLVDIPIPFKIQGRNDLYEEVAAITGIAIPSIIELEIASKLMCSIEHELVMHDKDEYLMKAYGLIDQPIKNIDGFLRLANVYMCFRSGYIHSLEQITAYDWISDEVCKALLDVGRKYVTKDTKFEQSIKYVHEVVYKHIKHIKLTGFIDSIDDKYIWEFKTVSKLTLEHKLQAIVYGWMWNKKHPSNKRIPRLLNLRTDELLEFDISDIDPIISLLMDANAMETDVDTDDVFIAKNKEAFVPDANPLIRYTIAQLKQECLMNDVATKSSFRKIDYINALIQAGITSID